MNKPLSPTMAHADEITKICASIKPIPDLEVYAVFMYLHNGEFTWLSNVPKATQKYMDEGYLYSDRLNRPDFTNHNRVIFAEEFTKSSKIQEEIYAITFKSFGFHRIYCLSRNCTDCRLILAANSSHSVADPNAYYQQTVDDFELLCCDYIDKTIHIFIKYLPQLAPTRFANDSKYRNLVITNRQDPPVEKLNTSELELLYWSAQGKTAEEISMILKLTKSTIETYRKRICRKLNAKNLTHAVYLAKTLQLLV